MKRSLILAFAWLVCAAAQAVAGTSKFVSVPPGGLPDALDSLAKQYGVDIIYPSNQLKGLETKGLNGSFELMGAFKRLIEGTPLMLSEVSGALLITQAAHDPDPTTVPHPQDPLAEVEIEARRADLSTMKTDLLKLEQQFYDEYNKLNTDRDLDITCTIDTPTGTHVGVRFCQPVFAEQAVGEAARAGARGYDAPAAGFVILLRTPEYQKHLIDIVSQHPELLELLKERNALAERYASARRWKAGGGSR